MTKKNQEQNNNIEKNTGFVPVQYKILKLDANYPPKLINRKRKVLEQSHIIMCLKQS